MSLFPPPACSRSHSLSLPPFLPLSPPLSLALLQCRVADLEKTVKFYEALGMINLREKVTPEYSASVMGFGCA
jgi:hypothetical protein